MKPVLSETSPPLFYDERCSMHDSLEDSARTVTRETYPSDVTDRQWEQIEQLLPPDADRGRNRECSMREVVNAVNYRWLSGCSWRMLPHDLPAWQTVYNYFRRWQRQGLLSPLRDILISRSLRLSPPKASVTGTSGQRDDSPHDLLLAESSRASVSCSERFTSSWSLHSSCLHNRS